MLRDHRGERATGFVHTSSNIGVAVEPNPTASATRSRSTTVKRIRAWADQKGILLKSPDMDQVKCVFTGSPIGEEDPFTFIRCKRGGRQGMRIVVCLASCRPNEGRYDVLPIENGGVGMFKTSVANMTNAALPINRSLYY